MHVIYLLGVILSIIFNWLKVLFFYEKVKIFQKINYFSIKLNLKGRII